MENFWFVMEDFNNRKSVYFKTTLNPYFKFYPDHVNPLCKYNLKLPHNYDEPK